MAIKKTFMVFGLEISSSYRRTLIEVTNAWDEAIAFDTEAEAEKWLDEYIAGERKGRYIILPVLSWTRG